MRPRWLALLLATNAGCAWTAAEMATSPAALCVSEWNPADQCCVTPSVGLAEPQQPGCSSQSLSGLTGTGMPLPISASLSR